MISIKEISIQLSEHEAIEKIVREMLGDSAMFMQHKREMTGATEFCRLLLDTLDKKDEALRDAKETLKIIGNLAQMHAYNNAGEVIYEAMFEICNLANGDR